MIAPATFGEHQFGRAPSSAVRPAASIPSEPAHPAGVPVVVESSVEASTSAPASLRGLSEGEAGAAILTPAIKRRLGDLGIERVLFVSASTDDGAKGFDVRLSGRGGEVVRLVAYGTAGAPLALRDVVSRAVDLWANALAARLKADMVANLIATSGVERAQAHDVPAQAVR